MNNLEEVIQEKDKQIKTVYDKKYRTWDFLSPTLTEFVLLVFESGAYTPFIIGFLGDNCGDVPIQTFFSVAFLPQVLTYSIFRFNELFSKKEIREKIKRDKITQQENRPIYRETIDLKTNKIKKEHWIYFP